MPDGSTMTAGKGHNSAIEISQEDFLAWVARLGDQKDKKDAEAKAFQKLRKEARAAGVRLTALDEALKARDMERGDRGEHYEHVSRYLEWLKVPKGFQFTLFSDDSPDAFTDDDDTAAEDRLVKDAEYEGFTAGLHNRAMSENRHRESTPAGQAWIKQWHEGQKMRAGKTFAGDDDE